jgi:hypothetical protein
MPCSALWTSRRDVKLPVRQRELTSKDSNRHRIGHGTLASRSDERSTRRTHNGCRSSVSADAFEAHVAGRRCVGAEISFSNAIESDASVRERCGGAKILHPWRRYLLQWVPVETNCALAQFRTCLWPCVGRWASGQEAGQPPGARSPRPPVRRTLGRHDRSSENIDRQPEAKPAHLVLNGGRGLKQRRSGLFWSRRPSKGRHRRGLFTLARRAERDFPLQSKASFG